MTNYNEGTGKPRPTIGKIVIEAVFTAAMLAVLVWLVARYPEEPRWYDWAGVLVYALFTGWFLSTTIGMVKRYRAPVVTSPAPVTAYADRHGDMWTVREDGSLDYHGGVWPRDVVEREFGPLTPVHD